MCDLVNWNTNITAVYTYSQFIALQLLYKKWTRMCSVSRTKQKETRASTIPSKSPHRHTHTQCGRRSVLPWRGDDVVGARQIGEAAVLGAEVDVLRAQGAAEGKLLHQRHREEEELHPSQCLSNTDPLPWETHSTHQHHVQCKVVVYHTGLSSCVSTWQRFTFYSHWRPGVQGIKMMYNIIHIFNGLQQDTFWAILTVIKHNINYYQVKSILFA